MHLKGIEAGLIIGIRRFCFVITSLEPVDLKERTADILGQFVHIHQKKLCWAVYNQKYHWLLIFGSSNIPFHLFYNEIVGCIHLLSIYCLIVCARPCTEGFVNDELRIQVPAKKQTVEFKAIRSGRHEEDIYIMCQPIFPSWAR